MKILLVQMGFIGDVILSSPVVGALRTVYPQAEIWGMTSSKTAELLCHDKRFHGLLTFDKEGSDRGLSGILAQARLLRQHAFDIVFSLHRSARTSLLLFLSRISHRVGFSNATLPFLYHELHVRNPYDHDVLRNLSLLKGRIENAEDFAELSVPIAERSELGMRAAEVLRESSPYAVLFPASEWQTKRWRQEGFNRLAQHLTSKGLRVLVLGGANDREYCSQVSHGTPALNLAGELNLLDAATVVKGASLLVCNDSMALHLGSAFKVPTLAFFCATSPSFGFGPWRNRAVVLERSELSCRPCRRHGSNVCPTGTLACVTRLADSEALAAADRLLDGGSQ